MASCERSTFACTWSRSTPYADRIGSVPAHWTDDGRRHGGWQSVSEIERARSLSLRSGGESSGALQPKLILQSFLDFMITNGAQSFNDFVNTTTLRLVSTVHPNETERNTNLLHYNSIFDKCTASALCVVALFLLSPSSLCISR